MSDQKANVPSHIERLNFFKAQLDYIVPPYIQREVADILQWYVDALEARDKRFEEMSSLYQSTLNKNLEQARRIEQLEVALRKIKEALGEDFIVHELRCALDNSDPGRYSHPEDKRYCEEMRPHLEAVLKHFGGDE